MKTDPFQLTRPLRPGHLRELRLYRALGVKRLRDLLFTRERRWRGERGNVNYHLSGPGLEDARTYMGYVLYHCLLHTLSLLLAITAMLLLPGNRAGHRLTMIFLVLLCLGNLWCLMLQRYTYLRLRRVCSRTRERRRRALSPASPDLVRALSAGERETALRLGRWMARELSTGRSVPLGERELPALEILADLVTGPEERWAPEGTELAPEGPYGPVERRAAQLLRLTGSGVRTGWLAVMTEDERTERAFRRLAGTGRLEELEARLALLIAGLEAEQ